MSGPRQKGWVPGGEGAVETQILCGDICWSLSLQTDPARVGGRGALREPQAPRARP